MLRRYTCSLATVLAIVSCAAEEPTSEPAGTDPVAGGPTGTFVLSLEHDETPREALIYVPESYDVTTSTPLLLNFHGFGGTSEGQLEWADMRSLSDAHGFILAYPQGTDLDGSSHWNTSLPSPDNKSDASDFGFVDALIDAIDASYGIDADRVYAAGYSNGGMFAFALSCHRSDRIAAVVSVSGAMLDDVPACSPPPTAVMTLHGTEDGVIPYASGGEFGPGAQEVVDYWVDLNGITAAPEVSSDSSGGLAIEQSLYTGGTGGLEVHHYRVEGGGHDWFDFVFDGSTANELIWDFVSRFGRDGAL